MKIKYRLQTWAADNFASVQYPHIRATTPITPNTPRIDFASKVIIGVLSSGILLASVALIAAGLFVLYVVFFG